jgi:hypothetical protein
VGCYFFEGGGGELYSDANYEIIIVVQTEFKVVLISLSSWYVHKKSWDPILARISVILAKEFLDFLQAFSTISQLLPEVGYNLFV